MVAADNLQQIKLVSRSGTALTTLGLCPQPVPSPSVLGGRCDPGVTHRPRGLTLPGHEQLLQQLLETSFYLNYYIFFLYVPLKFGTIFIKMSIFVSNHFP